MTAFRIEIPDENWANADETQARLAGQIMKYFQEKYGWRIRAGFSPDRDTRTYRAEGANSEAVVVLATIAMGLDLEFVLTHIFEEMVDDAFNRSS